MKGTSSIDVRVALLVALFAVAATTQTAGQSVGFQDIGVPVSCGAEGSPCCIPGCQLEIEGLDGCTGTADAIAGACYTQDTDIGMDLCASAHAQAHFDRTPPTLDFTNSAGDAAWCTLSCTQATAEGQCAYSGGGCTCTGITAGTAP